MSFKDPLNELFISVDVESDGPIPLQNSMLSIGAVAFTPNEIFYEESFEMNLKQLPKAVPDPDTMKWWNEPGNRNAWIHSTRNQKEPQEVMYLFNEWVRTVAKNHKQKPKFAGYPASFDHMFVYVYSHYFLGYCEFSFQAWDAKTYASAILKKSFGDTVKSKMPKEWFSDISHGHIHQPLQDAIDQAETFVKMLRFNLKGE